MGANQRRTLSDSLRALPCERLSVLVVFPVIPPLPDQYQITNTIIAGKIDQAVKLVKRTIVSKTP